MCSNTDMLTLIQTLILGLACLYANRDLKNTGLGFQYTVHKLTGCLCLVWVFQDKRVFLCYDNDKKFDVNTKGHFLKNYLAKSYGTKNLYTSALLFPVVRQGRIVQIFGDIWLCQVRLKRNDFQHVRLCILSISINIIKLGHKNKTNTKYISKII